MKNKKREANIKKGMKKGKWNVRWKEERWKRQKEVRKKIEIKKSGTDKNIEGKKWMMGEYGGVKQRRKGTN